LLHYVTLGCRDLDRARPFYDATLGAIGMSRRLCEADELGYAKANDTLCRLWIGKPYNKEPAGAGNGTMIALTARSQAEVNAFHAAALANGGTDEGKPGLRPYGPNFYACYVRDPDGNKLSAVCEEAE
jgi:catechol 2,3-dioxygenase-like lactoylglutathione lyase family enzyme